jgi:hypothetical protein
MEGAPDERCEVEVGSGGVKVLAESLQQAAIEIPDDDSVPACGQTGGDQSGGEDPENR